MILALILLLLTGLIIAPLLSFMSTGLIIQRKQEQRALELYAADAGVEDALWKIQHDQIPPENDQPYPLTVNEMPVSVRIEESTTLYGVLVGEGNYPNYWIVELESELIDDPSDLDYLGDYTYRLILRNKHSKNIGIEWIKISFSTDLDYPGGYQVDGLYNGDGVELQKGEFADGVLRPTESGENQILTWEFEQGQTMIEGASDPDDPETWVTVRCILQLGGFDDAPGISNFLFRGWMQDIGTVWERKPFIITARAYDEDTVVTTVTARALRLSAGGVVLITHWEISTQ